MDNINDVMVEEQEGLKILILGGGNWGTAIARIIALNAASYPQFSPRVYLWTRDELYNERRLTDYINSDHENAKYLPGITLPENLVAVSDVTCFIESIDLLVFVVPHQFIKSVVMFLKGHVSRTARAISLVKGIGVMENQPYLFSKCIGEALGIQCSVLSGANVANDIAREQFSETTIGFPEHDKESARIWQRLFDTPTFKVNCVPDIQGPEVCGALKNVIALAAGFCDALGLGSNTKAAFIRIGFEEMRFFASYFFSPVCLETFFESAGYADVITTCFGGRNAKCAQEFALRKGETDWETLENELLKGQKLQGYSTCADVYSVIAHHRLQEKMPLFTTLYEISFKKLDTVELINRFATPTLRPIKDHKSFTFTTR